MCVKLQYLLKWKVLYFKQRGLYYLNILAAELKYLRTKQGGIIQLLRCPCPHRIRQTGTTVGDSCLLFADRSHEADSGKGVVLPALVATEPEHCRPVDAAAEGHQLGMCTLPKIYCRGHVCMFSHVLGTSGPPRRPEQTIRTKRPPWTPPVCSPFSYRVSTAPPENSSQLGKLHTCHNQAMRQQKSTGLKDLGP